MKDSGYTSMYGNKKPYTLNRQQLPAEICRQIPSDRKAEASKPITNAGKRTL